MKFLTFGFLFFGFVAFAWCTMTAEQGAEIIRELLIQCQDEEKGSADDLMAILSMQYPNTSAGKCMIACAHEKMEIVSSNFNSMTSKPQKFNFSLKIKYFNVKLSCL